MSEAQYYGYPIALLSYYQIIKARNFARYVEPWLLENIGPFGEKWKVEIDKDFDSLRLQFVDNCDEVTFKLAWQQGAKLDYEMEK